MPYSSTRMINYHEAKTFMRTASGPRHPIEGYADFSLGELGLLLHTIGTSIKEQGKA